MWWPRIVTFLHVLYHFTLFQTLSQNLGSAEDTARLVLNITCFCMITNSRLVDETNTAFLLPGPLVASSWNRRI